jgi:hypothetical protein
MHTRLDSLATRCRDVLARANSTTGKSAGAPLSAELGAALRGLLDEVERTNAAANHGDFDTDAPTVEAVLAAVVASRRSFGLRAQTPTEQVFLRFRDGILVEAVSTSTPQGNRLGELLVARGAVEPAVLQTFLSQPSTSGRIGEALLEAGRITDEDLRNALQEQRRRLLQRLATEPNLQLSISTS